MIPMRVSKIAVVCAVAVAFLSGCASTRDRDRETAPSRPQAAASDALMQPLRDLGFIRTVIPPELSRIVDPYAPAMGPGCAWLTYELRGLDSVLGSEATREADRRRSGSDIVQDAAGNTMRSAVNDLIPARGLVRQLSGAEGREKRMNEAIERGRVRRAYLMGLAHSGRCPTTSTAGAGSTVPSPVSSSDARIVTSGPPGS